MELSRPFELDGEAPALRLWLSSFRFPVDRPWKIALAYLAGLAVTGICTGMALPLYPRLNAASIAMLYVLGTAMVALRWGRGPATLASLANALMLDYLFIPPRFSLDVADPSNYFTLAVMLCVALLIAELVNALQRQRLSAELRERRTVALYEMSRQLCAAQDKEGILLAATQHVGHALTDPWCMKIAALHLQHMLETGEDMEKTLVTVPLADIEQHARELKSAPAPAHP